MKFKNTNEDLLYILKGMLEFNPYFRLSASECLKSKVFDDIRNPELERPSKFVFKKKEKKLNELNLSDIKISILKEIKKIK